MGAYTDVIADLEDRIECLEGAIILLENLIGSDRYIDEWQDEAIEICETALGDTDEEDDIQVQDETLSPSGEGAEEAPEEATTRRRPSDANANREDKGWHRLRELLGTKRAHR